jgi:hypothetical protein
VRAITGTDTDGTIRHQEHESVEGDVIASGTTDTEGSSTTPVERAQFILDTIRVYLARQACTHHRDHLASIEAILGTPTHWCPTCGTRLPIR